MIPPQLGLFLANPHRDPSKPFDNGYGSLFWYDLESRLHRDGDLPAVTTSEGYQAWYLKGNLHRATGPAIAYKEGEELFFILGDEYPYEVWLDKRTQYLPTPTSRYSRTPIL